MRSERAVGRKRVYDRLQLRQRRGVALMDGKLPLWRVHVDLDVLDMENQNLCLLGQQPAGYRDTLFRLAGTQSWPDAHRFAWANGFDVNRQDAEEFDDPYQILTELWLRRICA